MEDRLRIKFENLNIRMKHIISFLLFMVFICHEISAQKNIMSDESRNEGVSATYDELLVSSTGSFINNGEMFVYNDLSNEGEILFETQASVFNFKGQIPQKLAGSGTSLFSNVLFDNSSEKAPFLIEKNITIRGNADFSDGIISYSTNGLMIFDESADVSNVSQESFVTDKVRKKGNQEFVFPIGDNRSANYVYRKLKMEAPSNNSSVVDAQYLWENPGSSYNTNLKEDRIEIIDNQEYWEVDDFNGSTLPDLTFYWNTTTTPSSILTSDFLDRITVARWDGEKWIQEEIITIDAANSSIKIKPSGDGPFTFALLKTILPDYFPTLFTSKTQVVGSKGRIDFVVFVGEANGENSNGINPVELRISDSDRFQFSFNAGLNTLNGQTLDNSDWSYVLERGLHKFRYTGNGGIFPGNTISKIGIKAIFVSPSNSAGEVPLKVTIKADSGGQQFTGNDNDQDVIRYTATESSPEKDKEDDD
ncbi:hypothetical protein SAMN04489761_1603 [Tenacibaculum sp. MAR_2009_124]|uniref:hypothetical protein n=1 Tax=Tenacibaculum sp. MAR_2009_124 TaxID=1250059 RepID=UPI000899D9E2|nr:hypothetical protein [Tenacibaculum sp. MAR_2009_124]SEB73405.1 hypothetical protein SAMN04489761_1603 [Tenacibaculum sp. MAR_2009_124]